MRDGPIPETYKQVEKNVKNLIRNSKRKFEKKLASGNNGNKKPFYAYVKKQTGSRQSVGPLKGPTGETVADSEGMAELLNKA